MPISCTYTRVCLLSEITSACNLLMHKICYQYSSVIAIQQITSSHMTTESFNGKLNYNELIFMS